MSFPRVPALRAQCPLFPPTVSPSPHTLQDLCLFPLRPSSSACHSGNAYASPPHSRTLPMFHRENRSLPLKFCSSPTPPAPLSSSPGPSRGHGGASLPIFSPGTPMPPPPIFSQPHTGDPFSLLYLPPLAVASTVPQKQLWRDLPVAPALPNLVNFSRLPDFSAARSLVDPAPPLAVSGFPSASLLWTSLAPSPLWSHSLLRNH